MGFDSGSVSFRRFAVIGQQPDAIDQDLLDKLAQHALRESDLGVPEEIEYGWSGGRHIFDAHFSFEHNVFADALHFALRVDTNKAPGDVKKAYRLMEEEAAAAQNPSGFISKLQKQDAKATVRRKLEEDMRGGRFRRSKLYPILWDLPSQILYCSVSGAAQEKLLEIFQRTFDLELAPISAGTLALRILHPRARRRDYEDFRPTRFVYGPEGESQHPEYPWVLKGPEPKDFIGNEFALWLWHAAESRDGTIETGSGEISILIDKSLDLDCAYGQSGRDSLRGDGPSRMPEARDALRSGKLPRKFGLVLESSGSQFTLRLNAETLAISAGRLPEVPDADSPRVLFEERIGLIRDLCGLLDNLFDAFLKVRGSSSWEGQTSTVRRWILQSNQAVAAVA